jgi:hypothetical protein
MADVRLQQLVAVAKTINPGVGMVADLALMIFGSVKQRGQSKDLKRTIVWLEERVIELLERITEEAAKPKPSKLLVREIEIRIHETLDILIDMKQEKPWDG